MTKILEGIYFVDAKRLFSIEMLSKPKMYSIEFSVESGVQIESGVQLSTEEAGLIPIGVQSVFGMNFFWKNSVRVPIDRPIESVRSSLTRLNG